MELRYEVSPSEAGIVVDGLLARGYAASELNQQLGERRVTVLVTDVADNQVEAARGAVLALATDATPA